jgi:hypothetical protein
MQEIQYDIEISYITKFNNWEMVTKLVKIIKLHYIYIVIK